MIWEYLQPKQPAMVVKPGYGESILYHTRGKKIQIHITNESVLIQIPKEIGTNCNNMTLP